MAKKELTKFEKEFQECLNMNKEKIEQKLREASDALDEACGLSEKFGIPFHSNVSEISQCYIPSGLKDKWPDVPQEFIDEATDTWDEWGYGGGWQHSAVC